MAEARAARLAATEARLAGASTSGTNPESEIKKEIKKEEPIFEPTEKGDSEKKKEFTKLLFRGVVRDNGYKEAMGCVDVSPYPTSLMSCGYQGEIEVVAEIAVSLKDGIPSAGTHAFLGRIHSTTARSREQGTNITWLWLLFHR